MVSIACSLQVAINPSFNRDNHLNHINQGSDDLQGVFCQKTLFVRGSCKAWPWAVYSLRKKEDWMKNHFLFAFAALALGLASAHSYPALSFCSPVTYNTYAGGVSAYVPIDPLPDANFVEVMATVCVDSAWTTKDEFGYARIQHTALSLLAIAPVDTADFANDTMFYLQAGYSRLSFDTANFPRHIEDSTTGQVNPLKTSDTLRNAFVFFNANSHGSRSVSIVSGPCIWLKAQAAPFPLSNALASFNHYVTQNNLPRGYSPPTGDLRLGPVFSLSAGESGWRLRAWSDTGAWNIEQYVGGGDCPCGCTYHTFTIYRITSNGSVTPVDSTRDGFLAVQKRPASFQAKRPSLSHTASCEIFDCFGRKVGNTSAILSKGNRGCGIYFVREAGIAALRPAAALFGSRLTY
jgi:hypothetical protein